MSDLTPNELKPKSFRPPKGTMPIASLGEAKLSEAPRPNVLPPGRDHMVASGGQIFAKFDVSQPVGHTIEDALRPEYWVNHARFLKAPSAAERDFAGSKLELHTKDHAHYAVLYVRAVLENSLIVELIGEPVYLGQPVTENGHFKMVWNVGKRGYDIINETDRTLAADGAKFPTKEMAQAWIDKTLTRAA
jgi:hypothetical protein